MKWYGCEGYVISLADYLLVDRKDAGQQSGRLITEMREALDNVRQLGGLLPVCTWGREVRDDPGYWEQIETDIAQHSEAQFSYGIYPECFTAEHGLIMPEVYREDRFGNGA